MALELRGVPMTESAAAKGMARPLAKWFIAPPDFESFRQQESVLILLNLAVLAGTLSIHLLFEPTLGSPSRWFFGAVALTFLVQTLELIGLHGIEAPPSAVALFAYSRLSVWSNIGLAFLISVLGTTVDSHYVVLMVIPLITAAFRFSLPGILAVVAVAGGLTMARVWLYFQHHPPSQAIEYFEAANVAMIYLVVVLFVWFLVGQLRRHQTRLEQSLHELKQAQDRLVAGEKLAAVGRLASAIAHEIRNPVAMIASSGTLARRAGSGDQRDEMLDIVVQEASRLEKLTTDFLTYARTKPPDLQATSMSTALGYVAGLASARAAESSLQVEAECPSGLMAWADPFQIHQALLNLVVNAMDASPPGGRVLLRGEQAPGGGARVAVENAGGPIPPDAAGRIFEPFFTTKAAGTGLGLAIARSIALAHGGGLVLEDNTAGLVRFVLTLPGETRKEDGHGPSPHRG